MFQKSNGIEPIEGILGASSTVSKQKSFSELLGEQIKSCQEEIDTSPHLAREALRGLFNYVNAEMLDLAVWFETSAPSSLIEVGLARCPSTKNIAALASLVAGNARRCSESEIELMVTALVRAAAIPRCVSGWEVSGGHARIVRGTLEAMLPGLSVETQDRSILAVSEASCVRDQNVPVLLEATASFVALHGEGQFPPPSFISFINPFLNHLKTVTTSSAELRAPLDSLMSELVAITKKCAFEVVDIDGRRREMTRADCEVLIQESDDVRRRFFGESLTPELARRIDSTTAELNRLQHLVGCAAVVVQNVEKIQQSSGSHRFGDEYVVIIENQIRELAKNVFASETPKEGRLFNLFEVVRDALEKIDTYRARASFRAETSSKAPAERL